LNLVLEHPEQNSAKEKKDPLGNGFAFEDTAVLIRGVRKSYIDHGRTKEALRGVDLAIRRGSIHGVLGTSGAGKTTLLRCILRLEKPDTGEIIIGGKDWANLSESVLRRERHNVGAIFQHLHLMASRTVAANIALPLEFSGVSRERITQRVDELLAWFGISDKAQEYPSRLSGGQRQRVALARALATSPTLLLADEPTSALDTETKRSVLNILRRIRDEFGVTILLITHDLQAAGSLCDTLSVIDSGRIVETAPASRIFLNPTSPAAQRLFSMSNGEV
jgi:D-methionine transport system ATP-binding protein